MRIIFIILSLLALLSLPFAANYTGVYTDGWAKITRNVVVADPSGCSGGVTGACGGTGAFFGNKNFNTYVNITIENIGPVDRERVVLSESLAHVPTGAKISFSPNPSDSDGRSASWKIESLKSGEAKTIGYLFNARTEISEAESIRRPSVSSQPPTLALFAPSASKVESRISLSLQTLSGKIMPGTLITVGFPDGTSQEMRTDYRGKVSFNAPMEGFYTYSVQGFGLERMVSTEVGPQEEVLPVISAAVGLDKEIASFFTGLLPVLAVIFGVAVLALIIYNFFNSREDEEEQQDGAPSEPPAQYSPPAEAPVYTQKFSFADSGKSDDQEMRDLTRGLVESRKKQMQAVEVAEEEPQHNNHQSYQAEPASLEEDEKAPDSEEMEEEDAEVERELEKLEAQARSEGEVTEQEEEIESAIAELEEIRQKLRERRDQVLQIGEKLEQEQTGEPVPPKKPVPRVMPPRERVEPSVPPVKKK